MFLKKRKNAFDPADETLFRQLIDEGDAFSLGILFERYSHLVCLVALKYLYSKEDAEDVVMEIFGNLRERLSKSHVVKFKSWIYKVTINECLMRRRRNHQEVPLEDEEILKDEENNVEKALSMHLIDRDTLRMEWIHEAMAALEGDMGRFADQFYREKKSYSEIAQSAGVTVQHVKNCLQVARRSIRNYVEQREIDYERAS